MALDILNPDTKKELSRLFADLFSIKHQFRTLYENSPDPMRTINNDGIILNCNKSYAHQLGYSKKELIGSSIFDTVPQEHIDELRDSFETWKSTGYVKNSQVWFKRKDGTTFPTLISANNLYDEDGNLIGSNTVIRDIADIYESRKELEEYKDKLQKEMTEKDEFMHLVTEEIRSAVIRIVNTIEDLSQQLGITNGIQLEKLEAIKSRSRGILKMLVDIYDVQKIGDGLHLVKNRCSLADIISGIISTLHDDLVYHGTTVTTDLENVSCLCDVSTIKRVLTQVITNAIDFSPKGDGKIKIKLGTQGQYAKIIVLDNGIGIQKDRLDKIFEKFCQLDTSILREHDGAGLGLFICKCIIEAHKGKIWAKSRGPRYGTQIHILLPLEDHDYYNLRKI